MFYTDSSTFTVSDVRTFATGLNRFGMRALQFAAGNLEDNVIQAATKGGGLPSSELAQWGRISGAYTEFQNFDVLDADSPFIFVGEGISERLSTAIPDYGILWGREPQGLQENGSEEIDVVHENAFAVKGSTAKGAAGYLVSSDGAFYQTLSQVRNEIDNQTETIRVRFERVAGEIQLTVFSSSGAFSDYAFRFEGGGPTVNRTFAVGVPNTFDVSDLAVFVSGAVDIEGFASSATQDYFNGYVVDIDGGTDFGTIYITPNWDSDFADVDVRAHGAETDVPHIIRSVTEYNDIDGLKTARTPMWTPFDR